MEFYSLMCAILLNIISTRFVPLSYLVVGVLEASFPTSRSLLGTDVEYPKEHLVSFSSSLGLSRNHSNTIKI